MDKILCLPSSFSQETISTSKSSNASNILRLFRERKTCSAVLVACPYNFGSHWLNTLSVYHLFQDSMISTDRKTSFCKQKFFLTDFDLTNQSLILWLISITLISRWGVLPIYYELVKLPLNKYHWSGNESRYTYSLLEKWVTIPFDNYSESLLF